MLGSEPWWSSKITTSFCPAVVSSRATSFYAAACDGRKIRSRLAHGVSVCARQSLRSGQSSGALSKNRRADGDGYLRFLSADHDERRGVLGGDKVKNDRLFQQNGGGKGRFECG